MTLGVVVAGQCRKIEAFPMSGAPGDADKIPEIEVTPEMIEGLESMLLNGMSGLIH